MYELTKEISMKILVLSDTHGDIEKAKEVIKKHKDIDLIIHCGDFIYDALELQKTTSKEIIMVKGNCDGARGDNDYIKYKTPYGYLLIAHGHQYGVKRSYLNITYKAKETECVCAVFGHTHMPYIGESDGIKLFNPGSLSRPSDGSNGSYGIIISEEDNISFSIEYYSKNSGKKVIGGRLRSMINHSDRY
jgi:hypothetical protein